jgi:hypothetical protein
LIPVSFRIPDTRIGLISLTNPSIRANNFEFSASILPFLPCYLLVKLNLEEIARFCISLVHCVKSLLTRVLPCIGFTFNKLDSFCTVLYCTTLYQKIDRCASRLHNFSFNRQFAVDKGFTFDAPDHRIIIYIASVYQDTVFASRDCINPFSTGILLYTGFTFEVPKHQSYIYIIIYISVRLYSISKTEYCTARL